MAWVPADLEVRYCESTFGAEGSDGGRSGHNIYRYFNNVTSMPEPEA